MMAVNNWRIGLKFILKLLLIYFIVLFSGTTLLIGVYLLPTGEMKKNVARSSEIYNYEGIYPQIINGYKASQLDNYSDAYMFASAIHPGSGNAVKDAMTVKRFEYVDMMMHMSLTNYANDADLERYEINYPRYWHGYLVLLKPLLLFFDIGDIRMFNMILQLLINFMIVKVLLDKKEKKYALAFLMVIILINPITVSLSIHYSSVFYIAMIATLFLLIRQINNPWILFFVMGMITSYFDQFTYPFITLGIPLITILFISDQSRDNWRQQTRMFFFLSVMWGIGYLGMWGGKAVLGSILSDENIIRDLLNRSQQYTTASFDGNDRNFINTLWRNIKVLLKWPYLLAFGGTMLYFIIDIYKRSRQLEVKLIWHFASMIPYLLVMLIPFIDMFISGHSYHHYYFTYRVFAVTLFSGYCMLIACLAPGCQARN